MTLKGRHGADVSPLCRARAGHQIKLVLRFFQQFTAHGHKSGSVRLKEKQTGQKLKIYFSFVVVISCF